MSAKTTEELRAEILEEERIEREKKEDEKRKKVLKKEMKQKEKDDKRIALSKNPETPTADTSLGEYILVGIIICLIMFVVNIIQIGDIPDIRYRQDVETGFCFAYTRSVHMMILQSDSLSLVPCTVEVLSHIPAVEPTVKNK